MKVRIDTVHSVRYNTLNELYGHILSEFNLEESNKLAYITINNLDDIKKLDMLLEEYICKNKLDDDALYFGLRLKTEKDELTITIEDDYDD